MTVPAGAEDSLEFGRCGPDAAENIFTVALRGDPVCVAASNPREFCGAKTIPRRPDSYNER
jgi:hypothetical protein